MLICFWFGNGREVKNVSRMQHRVGEDLLFDVVHPLKEDCHQQRADLIVGDGTVSDAINEEADLLARELCAVALFSNDVLWSQTFCLPFRESIKQNRKR